MNADTDEVTFASSLHGTLASDGFQSDGPASPANIMEGTGGGSAARPPLSESPTANLAGTGSASAGMKQRFLVVANRLPVAARRHGKDQWSLEISPGGVVSGLRGVKSVDAKWIGWPGLTVAEEAGQRSLTEALAKMRCVPVFLDDETFDQYYNGYHNGIIWPLLHYLGLPQEDRVATTRNSESQFRAYERANQAFADVVLRHYREGDVVWCHDSQLMCLPKCLKDRDGNMKVGWFLHTPFPSSEIYRTLPTRFEMLRSLLSADLLGFHTYDFARHFVSACTRILGLEGTPEGVIYQGRLVRVAAFPIGIDSDRFKRALELPEVQTHINSLTQCFAGRKVILGVDRLDMIKGIPQKNLAFERFLEENPDWNDKVVLLQIAVPTRTDVPEYQKLKTVVHEMVGRINGRFGTLTGVPIHHLDKSLDFNLLCALYAVTDVALVTSLRDGMNLVSYEYIACQGSKKGVLILSEFAGAAQSLGGGAILVNPWNITEVADSMHQALTMSSDEREKRHKRNYDYVTTHTAQDWAEAFVCELNKTVAEEQMIKREVPPSLPCQIAIQQYLHSKNRLIILGLNGTLTEQVKSSGRRAAADQIKEMELKLHPDLKGPLKAICEDECTTVIILSGSDMSVLDANFGEFNMWLAAEHGMFLRKTDGQWMTTMPEHLNIDWIDSVKHIIEYFTERTPRSYFKQCETSFVWNYKYADIEFGRVQARNMLQHLWTGPISNAAVDIVQGSQSVEVRSMGITKGAAIDRILAEVVDNERMVTPIDYVLCIGHFLGKDEDIYAFFDPDHPPESKTKPDGNSASLDKSNSSSSESMVQKPQATSEGASSSSSGHSTSTSNDDDWCEGFSVLDLTAENYFSCTVRRERSNAHYQLNSSEEVVSFLKELATAADGFQNGTTADGGVGSE